MAREGFADKHVGMTALRSCHPGGRDFWKGRAGKVFEAILDPHKTRKTPSCESRGQLQHKSEGGGFRKSPQRNLPEQKTRRYTAGVKGGGKGGEGGRRGRGKGGSMRGPGA